MNASTPLTEGAKITVTKPLGRFVIGIPVNGNEIVEIEVFEQDHDKRAALEWLASSAAAFHGIPFEGADR